MTLMFSFLCLCIIFALSFRLKCSQISEASHQCYVVMHNIKPNKVKHTVSSLAFSLALFFSPSLWLALSLSLDLCRAREPIPQWNTEKLRTHSQKKRATTHQWNNKTEKTKMWTRMKINGDDESHRRLCVISPGAWNSSVSIFQHFQHVSTKQFQSQI